MKRKNKRVFGWYLAAVIILINLPLFSQAQNIVSGRIIDTQNTPVSFIAVLVKGTTIGAYTDDDGKYRLTDVPSGKQTLVVSGAGIQKVSQDINVIPGKATSVPDIQVTNYVELDEVVVVGKSEARRQQEQAFAISVADLSKSYNTSVDIGTITNRMAGVKLRVNGGVGSDYNFTLNGFSGRQVKFFMDGLAMDNFGDAFSINNLPANMVERVEVYKGVLPVGLGADALGGAVNVITRKTANYLDVSYSFGSFNTHKASINGAYTNEKTGFTARLTSFLNYSDNNYKVYVPIIDLKSGQKLGNQWVKRFHDGYKSLGVRLETGFVNRSFADYLLAGVIVAGNDKDIQNGVVMDLVYGARTTDSRSVIPMLRYKKSDLFVEGLGLSFYGSYSDVDNNSTDTVPRRYNWLGEWVPNASASSGERTRSQLRINNREWRTNTSLDYTLNQYHTLSLNHVYSGLTRKVSDVEDPANDYNKIPQSIDKHILGLGWMAKYTRWNATVFGKLYEMKGKTYVTNTHTSGLENITNHYTEYGYGGAFTYFLLPKLQAKVSYEHTYRLPEAFEMFGDNQENSRNADLKPESSDNVNVGLMYEVDFLRKNTLQFELGLLYRNSKDFIHRELKQPSMMYINLGKVLTKGVEFNTQYTWNSLIHASMNVTYQHITDNRKTTPSQTIGGTENENFNYKEKLPNIPYLFGNGNIGLNKKDIFIKGSELTVDYFLNYVKEYYLSWPGLGSKDSKDQIPKQLSHDVSVGYSLCNGRYNFALSCDNITNEMLYDNFKLQKPGRSFTVKFRYYLNK